MLTGDHFSGFTWGDGAPDKVQDNAIKFNLNIILGAGFGAPQIILTDHGTELVNKLSKGAVFFNYGYLSLSVI